MPQLAAQDDEVLFDLSAFFMNLEAKRRDAREKEKEERKKRKELGGSPSGSGDVPVMALRQAPAGQDVEPCGSATLPVQAWVRGEYV